MSYPKITHYRTCDHFYDSQGRKQDVAFHSCVKLDGGQLGRAEDWKQFWHNSNEGRTYEIACEDDWCPRGACQRWAREQWIADGGLGKPPGGDDSRCTIL